MLKFFVLAAIVGMAASGAVSVGDEVHAETKSILNEISPEGVFHYAYETSNGIDVNSAGDEHSIKGAFNYVSPEGEAVHLTYVADENGYQPQGEHLPTSPPIPEAIARAVEYIQAHPASDDVKSKGSKGKL